MDPSDQATPLREKLLASVNPGSRAPAAPRHTDSVPRVDGSLTFFVDQQHFIGVFARALHTGRAYGHAGHRQSLGLRLLCKQPPNILRRYMTLDEIAVNHGRVAGA